MKTKTNLFKLSILLFGISFLLWNCEKENQLLEEPIINNIIKRKVYISKKENIPSKIINFLSKKTEYTNKVYYSNNRFSFEKGKTERETHFGYVDESTSTVVEIGNEIRHTFSVQALNPKINEYINLVIISKENSVEEYFIKYVFDDITNMPRLNSGAIDIGLFTGDIYYYNSSGTLIGNYRANLGVTTSSTGESVPAQDCSDSNTDTTGDTNNDNSNNDSSGNPSGGGGSSVDVAGGGSCLKTFYEPCGCGGNADGHAPSGSSCCFGSPGITISSCGGNLGRSTNTTNNDCPSVTGIVLSEKLNLFITTLTPEQLIWFNNPDNFTERIAIISFLVEENLSTEAQNFALLAIEALEDGGEVDFEDKIINRLTGKAKCVYDKLKSFSSGFKNLIKKFDGDFPVAHLQFTEEDLGIVRAQTRAPDNNSTTNTPDYIIEIVLNNNSGNEGVDYRPNLLTAKTIAHEILHAEMFRKLLSLANQGNLSFTGWNAQQQTDFINNLRNDFPGLFDYYTRYDLNSSTPNNAQHQLMATHYRETLAGILQEFDTGVAVPNNTQPQQLYMDLAWEGLQYPSINTWNSLPQSEKDRINGVISNYINDNKNENCQ